MEVCRPRTLNEKSFPTVMVKLDEYSVCKLFGLEEVNSFIMPVAAKSLFSDSAIYV